MTFADDVAHAGSWQIGDRVSVEFADLGAVQGIVVAADARGWVAQFGAHITAKGTSVGPKRWTLEADAVGLKIAHARA